MIDFLQNLLFGNESHVVYMFFFIFNNIPLENLNFDDKSNDEFLHFIDNDNFKPSTLTQLENGPYLNKLENLKKEVCTFYELSNQDVTNIVDKDGKKISNVIHMRNISHAFKNYTVQIKRLRMVIEPEFNITRVVQPSNKICYLAARGYWFDDSGKKKRVFTRNFGKEIDYPKGKDDPNAYEDARREIQILAINEYESLYH
jgi:hypothetical protein